MKKKNLLLLLSARTMIPMMLIGSLAAELLASHTTAPTAPAATATPPIAPNCKVASYIPPPPEPPQSKVYKCRGPSGDFTSTFTAPATW